MKDLSSAGTARLRLQLPQAGEENNYFFKREKVGGTFIEQFKIIPLRVKQVER